MLKTVSSVANALGALNYKGTWNADTNTPTLASGVGTQGDYYVVSVAGATDLDGITNWGVGDWAAFNGSVWQRVEGGADGNFVNLEVTGSSNFLGINNSFTSAGSANIYITGGDGNSKNIFFRKATGPTQQAKIQTIGDDLRFFTGSSEAARFNSSGNLAFPAGQGIDFSATAGTGSTSELLDDYEEGIHTATLTPTTSWTIGLAGSANSL